MKKIITLLFVSISFLFLSVDILNADCDYDPSSINSPTISAALEDCLDDSPLVDAGSAKIGSDFDTYILKWVSNISLYLGFFAVLSIVIGGFMLTISTGDDEKINKAKGVVKWGIIGFVGVISASAIITILVKIFYSI